MASSKTDDAGFDLERLRKLLELMEQHDLREVRLKKGSEQWHLRRGPQEVYSHAPMQPPPYMAAHPAAGPAPASPGGAAPPSPPADDGLLTIKSPMVGTFYRASSPQDPPFSKEGDRVTRDSVVCLVEAMKFFNQVKADCAGTIVKILINDGDPVEFGQPLFKVKPE
jgi:acetyl-CoA carboxylase biotin carboxyl carrier protein